MHCLLAFDTATERTHIALEAQGRTWTHDGAGGAHASATFLNDVMALLETAGMPIRALDAIAFGRGPGAFTGLRTACAVAQGLALGAGRPVLAIDTLLAISEDARGDAIDARIWALLDARMGELYAAEYVHDAAGWRTSVGPMLATPERLQRCWDEHPPEVVSGEAVATFASRLDIGSARRVATAMPRGVALLRLARELHARGAAVDAALALPLYVRDKVAETMAERAARVTA